MQTVPGRRALIAEGGNGKGSDDCRGLCRSRAGTEASSAGRASAHHPGDRRGALPWRPFRERGISFREGSQSLNEGRIAELEDKISRAEVIDVSKLGGDTIKFGATVTLVDEDTDEEKKYQIVGETEADVKSGRVSITSPIARALIGKRVGDTVEVNTPGGGKSYEILGIVFV